MTFFKRSGIMVAIAALVIAADQFTKWLVITRLELNAMWAPFPALSRYFTITYITNSGVAFGMFKGMSYIFAGVAIVVIIAILIYERQLPGDQWQVRLALGFQLGGAAGNLTDRLRLGGAVVDFLDFKLWPVFNVADSSLVLGVALLILIMLLEPATSPTQPAVALPENHASE